MSLSYAITNALSGLTAASRQAEVISANISNVNTDGYGRRVVSLSAEQVGGRGAGVSIDGIVRIVDRGLLAERRLAEATMAQDERLSGALEQLESLFGSPGSEMGLDARVVALEKALVAAGSDPASEPRLTAVLDGFGDVAASLRATSDGIQRMRLEAENGIAVQVETLNRALAQVYELNGDIHRLSTLGQDTSALMDQRQRAIDTISAIVPVREIQRSGGQVALMSTGGQVLIDGRPAEIGFEARGTITYDLSFGAGTLAGITINGDPINGDGAAGRLSGGSLGANFMLRDEILTAAQQDLDNLAADLSLRFEDITTDPTVLPGSPGLLSDGGTAIDPLDIIGLSARIAVNPAVDPGQGGALWRIRDGVAATTPGPSGRADQVISWFDALSDTRSFGATPGRSIAGHVSALAADIGTDRNAADDELAFSTARWETVRQAQLSDGVDTDYEMAMLLQVEEAYSASAKVMQTLNALMQRLLEI